MMNKIFGMVYVIDKYGILEVGQGRARLSQRAGLLLQPNPARTE